MTDDQQGEGTPQGGGRWNPLPQGDYDDGATAFVQLPEGGIDALLDAHGGAGSPLAAPGHGFVPPPITVAPATGTDPAATGSWTMPSAPVDGTQWQAPETGQQPYAGPDAEQPYGAALQDPYGAAGQYGGDAGGGAGHGQYGAPYAGQDDRFAYHPGATSQWHFGEGVAAEETAPAPGHDVTGQWSIPVAGGDLPDESGEFTTSSLVEQWGGTPPATLPGGAPAPWATQAAGRPWDERPGEPGAEYGTGHDTGHGAGHGTEYGAGHDMGQGAGHDTGHGAGHGTGYGTEYGAGYGAETVQGGAPGSGEAFPEERRYADEQTFPEARTYADEQTFPEERAYGEAQAFPETRPFTDVRPYVRPAAGPVADAEPEPEREPGPAPEPGPVAEDTGRPAQEPGAATDAAQGAQDAQEAAERPAGPSEAPAPADGAEAAPEAAEEPVAPVAPGTPAEDAQDPAYASAPEPPHDGTPPETTPGATPETDSDSEPEAEAEPQAEADAEPATAAEADAQAEAESSPETGPETGPESDTGPSPQTAPAPEPEPSAPESRSESEPAPEGPAPEGPVPGESGAAAGPGASHEEHPLASYVLRVNGTDRPVSDAWIGESLLYVLRERLGLAGAKDGCSQGECGACNVQVDGRLVASCLVPAVTAAGSEVRTVEGLATDGQPSDVQRALARCGAVQCGFCVPGMAMTVHDLLEGNPAPTELETRQALCGNLCRCSGYRGFLRAVEEVVAEREATAEAEADAADAAADAAVDEPGIPHQAGPGAGGVDPSAFDPQGRPGPRSPDGYDHPHGQEGGHA
ncbi:hypothetical protein SUDANB145_04539 [Streptomyces sp. enrichment culture]|uniref:(2Fe-2S)-binding protein n=1 Tax=Streptomyces sp. enrichment culture TaxID=1795815 RepID=UPI003F5426BB